MLCDYKRKLMIKDQIREIQANSYMAKIQAQMDSRVTPNYKELESAEAEALRQIEKLHQDYQDLENQVDKKISCNDVYQMLKRLKVKIQKREVQEMIWEIDDDLDGCIDWPEFRLMFTRNVMDKCGLEPSKMFNLTQFLIYDHNNNGRVSVDETMNMLYARSPPPSLLYLTPLLLRFGKDKMEKKLKELFGENMHETGREGGEISYQEFIRAVEKVQVQTFWNTTQGNIVKAHSKKDLGTMQATLSSTF
jgi:calmodulin